MAEMTIQASTLVAGRWRLESLLGQGGMSDVYRALDEVNGGEPVAVKIVRSPDPDLAERLAQEAKALAGFDHPGLVRLLDSGVHNQQAYLVMELVDGPTLASRLRRGPLSPRRVATLGAALGDALAYVHRRGIVHRDLKPANVLLGPGARVRLADFGIAKLLDASSMTVTGSTLGTASYMAPEQIEHHSVGTSADIWSLGLVLLESLLGQRVFVGTPAEVVARRLAGPLRLPENLPSTWRDLLSSMLEQRPELRPSASEVSRVVSAPAFGAPWRPGAGGEERVGSYTDPVAGDRPSPDDPRNPQHAATAVAGPPAGRLEQPTGSDTLAWFGPVTGAGDTAEVTQPARTKVAPLRHPSTRSRSPRWRYVLPVAVVVVVLVALGAWAWSANGSAHTTAHHRTRSLATTVPSTTTTTTTTTTTSTTAPLTTSGAAATLFADVQQGISDRSITTGVGTQILNQLDKTLSDADSGNPDPHALGADISNLDTTIANGAASGSIAPQEASKLTGDVANLASAIGASATDTTPTQPAGAGSTSGGPGPGGPAGHGRNGDGGNGNGQ